MIRTRKQSSSMMKMTICNSLTWMSQSQGTHTTTLKLMKRSMQITMIISHGKLVLKPDLVPCWFKDSKRLWKCPRKVILHRRISLIMIGNNSKKWATSMKVMKWIFNTPILSIIWSEEAKFRSIVKLQYNIIGKSLIKLRKVIWERYRPTGMKKILLISTKGLLQKTGSLKIWMR